MMFELLMLIVPFSLPAVECDYGIDDYGGWVEITYGNYGIDIWDQRGEGFKIRLVGPNDPR